MWIVEKYLHLKFRIKHKLEFDAHTHTHVCVRFLLCNYDIMYKSWFWTSSNVYSWNLWNKDSSMQEYCNADKSDQLFVLTTDKWISKSLMRLCYIINFIWYLWDINIINFIWYLWDLYDVMMDEDNLNISQHFQFFSLLSMTRQRLISVE